MEKKQQKQNKNRNNAMGEIDKMSNKGSQKRANNLTQIFRQNTRKKVRELKRQIERKRD